MDKEFLFDDPFADANAELAGRSRSATAPMVPSKPRASSSWLIQDLPDTPQGIAEQILDADARDRLRLTLVAGVGPRTTATLLEHFGSATAVLAADSQSLASVSGVGPKLAAEIRLGSRHADVDQIVHWCQQHDTEILIQGGNGYPAMLDDLVDAPPILFSRGSITSVDQMAVAIVGTRHATNYGIRQAERLAHALARAGVTIISGLARGIDAAAHEGALAAGGRTIAVLGGGLGHMYPPEHGGLAKAIAADGAVLSEHPPLMKPRSTMFPQRNRLVAGLALATLVVEAPLRSGSLITARLAGEMNRDVLAVPGPVNSRVSRGCHELIRDGATLVQNVDDILEVLGPMRDSVPTAEGEQIRRPSELKLNSIERSVLTAVGTETTPIDTVIQTCGLPAHQVIAIVSVLEMRRLVRRLSGQYVVRI